MRVALRLRRKTVEAVEQGGPHLSEPRLFYFLGGLVLPKASGGSTASFGFIPEALFETSLPWNAKYIYGVMSSFGTNPIATINAIAKKAGIGISSVKKAHSLLMEHGWIVLVKEGHGDGHRAGSPREFYIVRPK